MAGKQVKQNIVQGAAVLGISMILVKLLGALFKIFVLGQMNGIGSGYFNMAYNYFTPIYGLAIAGLPTAIAKIIAKFEVENRFRDIKKTLRLSMTLFILIGVIGSVFMAVFAYPFVRLSGSDSAFLATISVAPALFFLCITSALRGYYEGLRNMRPTAVSEVVEVIAKVVFGVLLLWITLAIGQNQAQSGVVFGTPIPSGASEEDIFNMIMPYAAAAAIWGVTLSCFAGMIYMLIVYKLKGSQITREQYIASPRPYNWKSIVATLIKIAVPISLGSFVLNLATLIDTMSVTNLMNNLFTNNFDAVNTLFGSLVPAESFNKDDFGVFLYGSYAYAFSIFNLIPAFTGVFGKSALPNVVNSFESRDKEGLKRNIQTTLRLSSMLAIPAGIGLCVLAEPVLSLLYPSRVVETTIAAPAMQIMGIAIIFLGVLTPAFNVLQAMNKVYLPVKLMVIGSIIKIIVNVITISIPSINIMGAAWGTLACYLFIVIVSIIKIQKVAKIRLDYLSIFIKPIIAGILCGVVAYFSFILFSGFISTKVATLFSIVFAGIIYVIVLIFIRGIAKDDVIMLPKGEKIAKTLEKRNLLG